MTSVIFATLFFVLLGESINVDATKRLGKCKDLSKVETDFNFQQYATENNGFWNGTLLPDTEFYRTVKNWWLQNIPTKEDGVIKTNIYYATEDGVTRTLVQDERVEKKSKGHFTGTVVKKGVTKTYEFSAIKYEKSQYFYYYGCSSGGEDDDTDYRFVLTHGNLKSKSLSEIEELDKSLGFKGGLIKIGA